MLNDLLFRLRALFQRKAVDAELDDELRLHMENQAKKLEQSGLPADEARRQARLAFGGMEQVKEECREARGLSLIDTTARDVRYALRMLRKSPGFTVVAVLTLALGIGANTATFSVFNAVMLRYLPVREPQRLVFLNSTYSVGDQSGYGDSSLTQPMFEQFRKEQSVFAGVMAYVPLSFRKVPTRVGAQGEELQVDMVSGNFFSGLGVEPEQGRTFTLDDEQRHAPLAVISHDYWTRRFARRPALGETMYMRGVAFTIIGVAQAGFIGLEHGHSVDVWIPLQNSADFKPWGESVRGKHSLYGTPNWWCLLMIGRLAPGVTEQQAKAYLGPKFQQLAYLGGNSPNSEPKPPELYFTSARGVEGLRDDYARELGALTVMVGMVLLIACSNVAMLLIARNTTRQREFSLRAALGASRGRVFRQLLTESLLLVAAGAGLGWLFAVWASKTLAAWARLDTDVSPDATVLLVTLGASFLAALVFGLAPLRAASRTSPEMVLKTSQIAASRRRLSADKTVVALQMALCVTLLVGAGLLVRTLQNLKNSDSGIHDGSLLVFGVEPPQTVKSDTEALSFHRAVLEKLRALPGVEAATLMHNRLGAPTSNNTSVYLDGVSPNGSQRSPVRWNVVGPDFLHVLGAHILFGRDFSDADTAGAPKVAIVDEVFAQRYVKGSNPIGHHIRLDDNDAKGEYTIVGVTKNIANNSILKGGRPTAYFPYTQISGSGIMHYELRVRGAMAGQWTEVRKTLQDFSADLLPLQPMTQQEQYEQSFSEERMNGRLAMFFGLLAAVLIATGLYGTLAYKVGRRTSEIGVRMALGAQRGQVLWMVLQETLGLAAMGILIGLPMAWGSARMLRSMLFGLEPGDPLTFAAALAGIALVALAAGFIPARRAASVDPMVALRNE
ncbi:MAG TPA: ABC transporter permease [Alphaproteobacteria bacterium]|nr:ABC transporter permease [Alphaproteobacteria bacterium]